MKENGNSKFLTIEQTAKLGILSEWTIRQRVAEGRCPCVRAGRKVYVNVPLFIELLDRESREAVKQLD